MYQSPGAPRYGDNHRPDDWNPDLDEHGQRDGKGEGFEADQGTYPVYDQGTSYPADKLHSFSDLDSSTYSQHHTLGAGHNQSSPGDHMHDGGTSKNIGAWTTFGNNANQATVWKTQSGATPSIGNGFFELRYCKIGTLVFVHIEIIGGSTTTWGGGVWTFQLPFQPRIPSGLNASPSMSGLANGFSATTNLNYMSPIWVSTSPPNATISIANSGGSNSWSNTVPATWGTTGQQIVTISFFYESTN